MHAHRDRVRLELALLTVIVVIVLLLRLWGISFGLPYHYHPDEPSKIAMAQNMLKTGDLNPHYFLKPTLFIYLNALAYIPYYLVGSHLGAFETPNDILAPTMLTMGVGRTDMPTTVLLGRLLTTLFAVLSVILTYVVGKQTYRRGSVGLLAASMMAVSATSVNNSRHITVNSFLVFAVLAVMWSSTNVYEKGRLRDYAVAGILTGIAVSFKYPGAVSIVMVLTAHFLREGRAGLRDKKLYLGLALVPLAFLVVTPYALLDYGKFLEDTFYEFRHYQTGHPGIEGYSLLWYLSYTLRVEGVIALLTLVEMARAIYNRSKRIILLSSFPIVYFVFISSFSVRNDRTLLPLAPFVCILSSALLVRLFLHAVKFESRRSRSVSVFALSVVALFSLGVPAYHTIKSGIRMNTVDSRQTAAVWIEENLPSGARIALEPYAPFVDPERFAVQGLGPMIDHTPEWYIASGFEYLVFSEGMFRRFYQEPDRYTAETDQYNSLFERFPLLRVFTDGGYEVRIHRIPEREERSPVSA